MAAPDVEAAQRALNAWLTGPHQIATDGQWGPASTAALKQVLGAAERRIKELETVLTNRPPATDADRKLAALRAALHEVIG
jgi:hypothetical protein